MTQSIKFEDHHGLIYNQAMYGWTWASQIGVNMSFEDMFQEASLAFVLAAQGFNQEAGIRFSTYYVKAAFSRFRYTLGIMSGVKNLNTKQREEIAIRKEENRVRQRNGQALLPSVSYGLNPISFTDMTTSGEDGDFEPFELTLRSPELTPEEVYEKRQLAEQLTKNLSPLAALVLSWLQDPPEEMIEEMEKQRAGRNNSPKLGGEVEGFGEFSINNAINFLGMIYDTNAVEAANVREELKHVGQQIGRLAA